MAEDVKAVGYQVRRAVIPTTAKPGSEWTEWAPCAEYVHENYLASIRHGYALPFETRAVYPQQAIDALRAEVERLRADRDSWQQQAADRVEDWAQAYERAQRAEAQAAAMHRVGTLLSNIAYNLAQDDKLSEQVRWSLDDARKQWDALSRAANDTQAGERGEEG